MAREAKNEPKELTVEQKLKALYQLQTTLSKIDEIKTLRGELPLEVQDLEDEIAGLSTRIDKIKSEVDELKSAIAMERPILTHREMGWTPPHTLDPSSV